MKGIDKITPDKTGTCERCGGHGTRLCLACGGTGQSKLGGDGELVSQRPAKASVGASRLVGSTPTPSAVNPLDSPCPDLQRRVNQLAAAIPEWRERVEELTAQVQHLEGERNELLAGPPWSD